MLRELNENEMEMVSGGLWTDADTIHGPNNTNLSDPGADGDLVPSGGLIPVPANRRVNCMRT